MAFSYLEPDNLKDAYTDAKDYMRPLQEPFSEWERIAKNQPHPSIPAQYPKVTDGTTASYVDSRPKSIIQQIPTGKVEAIGMPELASLGSYILTNEVLANANCDGSVLQKSWNIVKKGLTYGSQCSLSFYKNDNTYFGADFKLPYMGNVKLCKGASSGWSSKATFIDSWYQKKDIEYIIDTQKWLVKQSKERKDQELYESPWNLKKLEELKSKITEKEDKEKNPNERDRSVNVGGAKVIQGYQDGIDAYFYFFDKDGDVLYKKKNPDPRGEQPIDWFYADFDGDNPLGVGAVERTGGLQNLIDSMLQMFQYNQALMLNPPIIKRGNFSSSTLKFIPNAVWDLGTDQNNKAEAFNINSAAITNFSSTYGLLKSQILNINNTGDTSTSSEVGNPGFSKTSQGVESQNARVSIADNQLRKAYEQWAADEFETLMNLHFAESQGTRSIELTNDYIQKMKRGDPYFEATSAEVEYTKIKEQKFKFTVDASTSEKSQDSSDKDALRELMEDTLKYPGLQAVINLNEAAKRYVGKIGIDDPEELLNSPEEEPQMDEQGMPIDPMQDPLQQDPAQEQMQLPEGEPDMQQPEMMQPEPMEEGVEPMETEQLTEEDIALIQMLREQDHTDEEIQLAIQMSHNDYTDDEIFNVLKGAE